MLLTRLLSIYRKLTASDGVQGTPHTRGSAPNNKDVKLLGVVQSSELLLPRGKLVCKRSLQLGFCCHEA